MVPMRPALPHLLLPLFCSSSCFPSFSPARRSSLDQQGCVQAQISRDPMSISPDRLDRFTCRSLRLSCSCTSGAAIFAPRSVVACGTYSVAAANGRACRVPRPREH
ncbi:hypothetical protein BD414DRAFT_480159 [Trametes punicea]|nr:hypothetical protein BD414DRAFT_480159 [Trametes punicea]